VIHHCRDAEYAPQPLIQNFSQTWFPSWFPWLARRRY
jgi:hypothetical protein